MSLMECLWSRGMEQLGMEKMDAEVRVGWGWLMGVLAEIVEDGACVRGGKWMGAGG